MKIIIILFAALILIILFNNELDEHRSSLEEDIKFAMENAYFEGQADALKGDIKIKKISDSLYIWTKIPWESKSNGKIINSIK